MTLRLSTIFAVTTCTVTTLAAAILLAIVASDGMDLIIGWLL